MIKSGKKKLNLLTYVYCPTFGSRNAKARNHVELKEERACLVKTASHFSSPLH